MAFAQQKSVFTVKDQRMNSSFILLGLSSLLVAVSSLGGIGAVSALSRTMQDAQIQELSAAADPDDLEEIEIVDVTETMVLYGSLAMLFWCVIGALIGAWTYVFIIPDQNATPRRMAAKLVSAAGCGVTITPLVIHYGGLPKDPNLIGGIATLVAILSVGIIVDMFPLIGVRLKKWLEKRLPGG